MQSVQNLNMSTYIEGLVGQAFHGRLHLKKGAGKYKGRNS